MSAVTEEVYWGHTAGLGGGGAAGGPVVDPVPVAVGPDTTVSSPPPHPPASPLPNLRKRILNLSLLSQPR